MPILNQKGLAPIAVIALVVIIAVLGGGYYFMSQKGGVLSLPGLPGGVTLNPNCKYNDPDLCKFLNNWKTLKNYKVVSKVASKTGPVSEVTFQLAGEDRFHMMMSQGGKENWNTIMIGDITYTKDYSDNKWWKQKQSKQKDEVKEKFDFKFEDSIEQTEDKTEYKKDGKEACGSMQCFKYQVIIPGQTDMKETIWFDDREYLLRKMRTEDKEGNITETEFTYQGVSISEPSPTKDAKEDQVILPGGAVMPGISESDKKELEKYQQESQKMMQQYQNYTPPDDSGSEEGN